MSKTYAGIANPSFFIGVVENNVDQRHEGRVQVRVFGVHGTIDEVPSADLPWAIVLTKGGFEFSSIPLNSFVFGLFLDGRDAQQPLVIGVIPYQYLDAIDPNKNGWGVVPTSEWGRLAQGTRPEDFGQPQVSRLARGESLQETYLLGQETNRIKDIGIGGGSSDQLVSSDNLGVTARDDGQESIVNPNVAGNKNERAAYIRDYLSKQGMAAHIADGFIMNFNDESGVNSGSLNPNDAGLPAFGLAQWRGDRKDSLFAFASARGESIPSTNTQLDFLIHELQTNESSAWDKIKNSTSAGEAGALIVEYFERPAIDHRERRKAKYLSGQGFNAFGLNTEASIPAIGGGARGTSAVSIPTTTWSEPSTAYNAQYPYNRVIETAAGHVFELDDSPGAERIMLHHRSGAYIQMAPTTTTYKSPVDTYEVNDRNLHLYVGGVASITIDGDCHVLVKGNKIEEIMGDHKLIVHGNHETTAAGQLNMNGGDDAQIRAARVSMESNVENTNIKVGKVLRFETTETIHFKTKNMFFQTDENMNFTVGQNFILKSNGKISLAADNELFVYVKDNVEMKSDTKIKLSGTNKISLKSQTVVLDDVIRMAEGASETVELSGLTPQAAEGATIVTAASPATKRIAATGPK